MNIHKITHAVIKEVEKLCPSKCDNAQTIVDKFSKLFSLFSACHNMYNQVDYMSEPDLLELGELVVTFLYFVHKLLAINMIKSYWSDFVCLSSHLFQMEKFSNSCCFSAPHSLQRQSLPRCTCLKSMSFHLSRAPTMALDFLGNREGSLCTLSSIYSTGGSMVSGILKNKMLICTSFFVSCVNTI